MRITFDPAKREKTLIERGLDFRRAKEVFEGVHLTRQDDRCDYVEQRFITAGRLDERIVILVWPPRGRARRVMSMRKWYGRLPLRREVIGALRKEADPPGRRHQSA